MSTISNSDMFRLIRMERWATYTAEQPLSMENLIAADNGKNFSSILSQKEMQAASCGMDNIPQVDVMLVFGEALSVAKYAAEVAIRHKMRYGRYPAFATCGDSFEAGRMQHTSPAECYEKVMLGVGFAEEWVMKYHSKEGGDEYNKLYEIMPLIPRQGKLKVLVLTGAGHSLTAAQSMIPIFPEIDFCFFETPPVTLGKRSFESEKLDFSGYGADALLYNIIQARMIRGPQVLPLSGNLMTTAPCRKDILFFLKKGFALYCDSPRIWKYLSFDPQEGQKLYLNRKSYVENLPQDETEDLKKLKKLIVGTKDRLRTLGLEVI